MDGLWRFDNEAFRAIHVDLHRDWLDPVFWIISSTGLGYVQVLVVLIVPLLFSGRFRRSEAPSDTEVKRTLVSATLRPWRDTIHVVGPLLGVIAISGLVMSGLAKRLVERDRPSNLDLAMPQEGFFARSFPSGHSTTAFALAFMLLYITWGTRYKGWGLGSLGWAALVGLSRIYRGVHWPTDVLAGAFAGLAAASFVYLLMRRAAKVATTP